MVNRLLIRVMKRLLIVVCFIVFLGSGCVSTKLQIDYGEYFPENYSEVQEVYKERREKAKSSSEFLVLFLYRIVLII